MPLSPFYRCLVSFGIALIVFVSDAVAVKISIPGVSQQEGNTPVNSVDAFAISPDGNTVAFVANLTVGSNTDRLYTTTLSGGTITQVAASSEVDDVPAFTPDGLTLAYVDSDGGVDKLHRAPTMGGSGVVVDNLPVSFGFRLSPDGQTVVALTRDGTSDVLRAFPLAGGPVVTLSTAAGQGDADTETFNISPNGAEVYFATDGGLDSANETALFRVPITGGTPTQIPLTIPPIRVQNDDFDIDAVFFNGTDVLFKGDYLVNGQNRLFTLPLTGGVATEVVINDFPDGADLDDFALSPDGQYIAFSADFETIDLFEVFVVPAAGGDAIKVNDEFSAEAIDLDVTGDGVPDISDGFIDSGVYRDPLGKSLRWSPDSRKILYLADGEVNEAYEIYVVDNPLFESTPGDYNSDGVVDAADYTVWRDTLNSTTDLRADGNQNNMIDQGDYMVWRDGYAAGAAGTAAISAPTPSSGVIVLTAWIAALHVRRRSK